MNRSGPAVSWHLTMAPALVSDIPITARISQNAQQARPIRIVDRLHGHDGCPTPCLLLLQIRRTTHAKSKAKSCAA